MSCTIITCDSTTTSVVGEHGVEEKHPVPIRRYHSTRHARIFATPAQGSPDDLLTQLNLNEQALSKSGDCWVLD